MLQANHDLYQERFPRSNRYDPDWVKKNQMGPSALWLTEWLCEKITIKPEMRVLDLGCGKAMSSIFLAREFGRASGRRTCGFPRKRIGEG